jgi:hypothetical protein
VGAHLGWPHLGVTSNWRAREPPRLHRSRRVHPRPHHRRALALLPVSQLLVLDAWYLDVDIDAI